MSDPNDDGEVNPRPRNGDIPAILDKLWAVVVEPDEWGRLKWSPPHQDWLPWLDSQIGYLRGFAAAPLSQPLRDDIVASVPVLVSEVSAAIQERFANRSHCARCGGGVADHYAMPDVFGEAKVYCVQLPDTALVPGSTVKHWASLAACRRVSPRYVSDQHGYEWIQYTHGDGVPASLAVSQPWCRDCRTAAKAVAARAKREGITTEKWLQNTEKERIDVRRENRRYR